MLSLRAYAAHRKSAGLPGGSLGAVQKAIKDDRIKVSAGGIDPKEADMAWLMNTNPAKQSNAIGQIAACVSDGQSASSSSTDFVRGKEWMARRLCIVARREWPSFVAGMSKLSNVQRVVVVALMMYLLEGWASEFITGNLPSVDWTPFGPDADETGREVDAMIAEWRAGQERERSQRELNREQAGK